MINGYIDVNTRTGALDANINSCAKETIEFNVSFDAGLTVAILSVEGKTLALSTIEDATSNSVTINTMTVQAYEHTHELGAGQSLPIVIAIGDSNHLQALVTGRMQYNSLYDKAPPEDLAPEYPTSEALKALLDEMQAASNAAAQSATAASKSAEEAGESASEAAASADSASSALSASTNAANRAEVAAANAHAADISSANSAAAAETAKADAQEAAAQAAQRATAAQSAKNSAESAATAAKTAQGKAEAAQAAAQASAEDAESAQTAAAESATAAAQSAQAAAEGVTALLQGKVDAAEAAKAGAEAAKTAAETAKTGADAAKAAAASSATSAANSATAAKQSATDLAYAVATAESLDGRISTIEGYGTQYKRDFRIDTTGLVNPLATSLSTSSPFASIYRRTNKGYAGRYFSDCQCHIFNDYDSAYIYDQNGKYLGHITNTGASSVVVHAANRYACLTTQIGDYRYGIFNGIPYNQNKMIISKFARNADNTDYELVASRVYATRGVEGAIFQYGDWQVQHWVGPVVPSRRTGHILVFGAYYMSVKNDAGEIVNKSIGYGYIVFDSDLNFVKWDETTGAFISSETFDESYFHAVSGRITSNDGITAYWADTDAKYLSLVAIQQAANATNGLYYVDPHDNLVPITFSRGPYADAGIDYLPLGGSLLSVDSTALFSSYAPRLVMSGVQADSEVSTTRVVKIFNGARMFYITMTKTDEEPGCTFTYRWSNTITQTQFNGSRISDNNYLFLHGRYTDTYSETQLFLYRNGYIYSSDGKYVRSLTLPTALAQISPQRGMYARRPHLQFAPCGGYQSATGALLLDM